MSKTRVAGHNFPARTDLSINVLDAQGYLPRRLAAKPQLSFADAEVRADLQGFGYCDREERIDSPPFWIKDPSLPSANRINGELIRENGFGAGHLSFDVAFQEDEYVYFKRRYQLVNIFGGL